jgi:hypothetical protein
MKNVVIDGVEYVPTKRTLAYVDGRAVYFGDAVYSRHIGKVVVIGAAQFPDTPETVHLNTKETGYVRADWCSWNPPKPKTVMVELLREDAEFQAEAYEDINSKSKSARIAAACRKALESK